MVVRVYIHQTHVITVRECSLDWSQTSDRVGESNEQWAMNNSYADIHPI